MCELLRANLYEFQRHQREHGDAPYFTPRRLQAVARQVLTSLAFLHGLGLIHSDLKPENILVKSYSRCALWLFGFWVCFCVLGAVWGLVAVCAHTFKRSTKTPNKTPNKTKPNTQTQTNSKRCEVKVIDLGSSCFASDRLSSYVQSRSYRAPEVILGLPYDARVEGILGPLPGWMVDAGRHSHRYYTPGSAQLYERSRATGRCALFRFVVLFVAVVLLLCCVACRLLLI